MAASGIQEHNEARRKERVLMKKAHWEKHMKDAINSEQISGPSGANNLTNSRNTYAEELISRRVGSPPGIRSDHNSMSVDRQRRIDHYNQQQSEYSAKIPHRYKNFDYLSQW